MTAFQRQLPRLGDPPPISYAYGMPRALAKLLWSAKLSRREQEARTRCANSTVSSPGDWQTPKESKVKSQKQ